MKSVKSVLCLIALTVCGMLTSCSEESDIFPQDKLETGGNGEGSDPIDNKPPGVGN